MPRRLKPHHHEFRSLPVGSDVPFVLRRALYCRLSDDDEGSVSIEHQIEKGQLYAATHGLVIVAIYIDWRTGFDPDRLALTRLIEDAHAGKHPGIVFYDHYRFHRGVTGAYPVVRLHAELPEYTFEATVGGYDISQIGIWAGISGMEADTTRRRSMEQRRTRAERGQWMAGMKPYWLDRNPQTLKAEINEERAAAFLHALELYARPSGSSREACTYLTENAPLAPQRNASRIWTYQRFRNLLRNPALWGELPYARGLDVKERRNGRLEIVKRVSNPQAIKFSVPPLIHKNELEKVECRVQGGCSMDSYPSGAELHELIAQRNGKVGGRPYAIEHPLRHTQMLCACGWRVRWQVRRSVSRSGEERSYDYVACAARMAKGRTGLHHQPCGMQLMPVDSRDAPRPQGGGRRSSTGAVWPKVRAALVSALSDPYQLAEEQRQQVLAEHDVQRGSLAEEAERLEHLSAAIAQLDDSENRLYERYDKHEISKNVYERQAARIDIERREAEEQKRQILAHQVVERVADAAATTLLVTLSELGELQPALITDAEWSRILPDLVEAIDLDLGGKPTIRWRRPS